MQVGVSPDHSPFTWQVLKALPLSMNPLLQTYIALDPSVVPGSRMRPFSGEFSLPQSTPNGTRSISQQNLSVLCLSTSSLASFSALFMLKVVKKQNKLDGRKAWERGYIVLTFTDWCLSRPLTTSETLPHVFSNQ